MKKTLAGIGLYLLLLLPSVANAMESVMIVHMLIQMPLLIISGYLIGKKITPFLHSFFKQYNRNGIPGILIVVFISVYWMFPRAMDETLVAWYIELFKYITLPLAGILITDSWSKLTSVVKGFIYLNYLSMFGLMAWLYVGLPVQICNNYLESEQKILGWGFGLITICMVIYLVQLVFIDRSNETGQHSN